MILWQSNTQRDLTRTQFTALCDWLAIGAVVWFGMVGWLSGGGR